VLHALLAETTGRKKSPKISQLGTIAQLCRAISSQIATKAHVDSRKKTC